MGQQITVVEKPAATPGVVRFETNRTITGTAHERYLRDQDIQGDRPADELARRLFARGGIDGIHIHSNVITVDLSRGAGTEGLQTLIHELFTFYRPGVVAGPDGMALPDPGPAATTTPTS